MLPYRHRQIGWVMLGAMACTAFLLSALAMAAVQSTQPLGLFLAVNAVIVVIAGVLFSSMTVRVLDNELCWHFGPGFWRNSIPLPQLKGAAQIKTKWYWGYGIKYFGPGRWLYNVSGTDAVELQLGDGGWVRLGTDDVAGLMQALRRRGL